MSGLTLFYSTVILVCFFLPSTWQSQNSLLSSPIAFGGSSTHGTDMGDFGDEPWFLGDTSINYCLEVMPDYPFPKTELSELVAQSFADWLQFFQSYGLLEQRFAIPYFDKVQSSPLRRGIHSKLASRFQELASCSEQAELRHTQLIIRFGGPLPSEINTYEGGVSPQTALGAAYRYKPKTEAALLSGGIVWISAHTPLKDLTKLKAVLLHELGHVFGMAHNSLNVMDSNLTYRLAPLRPNSFNSIEAPDYFYRLRAGMKLPLQRRLKSAQAVGISNDFLPEELKQVWNTQALGTYTLDLLVPADYEQLIKQTGRTTLSLVFQEIGGTAQTIEGSFEVAASRLLGPHIVAPIQSSSDASMGKAFLYLDATRHPVSFQGFFKAGDTIMPAFLEVAGRLELKLFLPGKRNIWWSIAG